MQASGMHEEVDAIKKQLKLLGHTVPTNVIVNFLQNNNQLFPSYAVEPTSQPLPRSPTSLQHTGSVHDRAANQPHYLPESSTLPPNCMQQAAAHTPQLDTAWAGPGSASLYDGANDQVLSLARRPILHSADNVRGPAYQATARGASTVRPDVLDQATCQQDLGREWQHLSSDGQPSHIPQAKQHAFVDFEDEYTALRKTLEELNASLDDHQPHAHHQPASQDPLHSDVISQEPPGHAHTDSQVANAHLDDKDWYKQDATVFRDSIQEHFNTRADLQQEPSYADSHRSNASRRHNDRKQSTAAPSVLGSISQRNLPVLNNSFIVPAQATKPKKVDRVNRHKELQQAWSKDSFIKSGGTAKSSKRRSENFSELFAACHAAEDRLKDLTLKHGRAVKTAAPKTRQQQENIVPTAKRRDALRWETRMRMQIREDII